MTKETEWEKRYLEADTPWDKGEPAPGLIDWLQKKTLKEDARVLVPGCGRGHDASAWAKAEYETTGMDLSDLALSGAREKYESLPNLAFFPGNFLEDKPQEPYDLIFEHTLYCAIDPIRRDEYAQALNHWLKPGGYFLAIHFVFPLSEEGPPFGASKDEIIKRFESTFELIEDWKPRHFDGRRDEEWMFLWKRKE
ncbi:TPMT family class I SAM-dependent methyltransferase [Opitutales bacterium]|nr:TPMT family class I SAM-dependent methyltransferase [Opitutales bacterium]